MSRTTPYILACLAAAALGLAAPAVHGGTVQFQLGEQDFADGKTPVYSREIRKAGVGEAYPFDGTIFGHDLKSTGLGSFGYTHAFDLGAAAAPVSATLTIGLIDIDSPADQPLDTISVTFDGFGQVTDMLVGISALNAKSSVEVVDIPVPVELLKDGALNVTVTAKRPGYANIGNAIEADFSRLAIETIPVLPGPLPPMPLPEPTEPVDPPPAAVPLPPVLLPAGAMIVGFAALPKRRLRRWLRV